MALVAAKCTNCGANIEVDSSKDAGLCTHCGTAFITEKAINNYNTYNTFNTTLNNTTNITGNSVVNVYSDEINKFYVIEGTTLTRYNGKQSNFRVPDGITVVATEIFKEDWSPKSIYIPKSVVCIERSAFENVGQLESLTFEEGSLLKTIELSAFENLRIDHIVLPHGLEKIGESAFAYVKSVYIPETVKNIGKGNFEDAEVIFTSCSEIPAGWEFNNVISIITGVNIEDTGKQYKDFIYADTSNGPVIYDYKGKEGAEIPSEIEGQKVCDILPVVYDRTKAQHYIFKNKNITKLSNRSSGYKGFAGSHLGHVTSISFEEPCNVKAINEYAFSNFYSLKSLSLPDSVEYIGRFAFNRYDASRVLLETIRLSENLKEIDEYAFYGTNLRTLTLPKSVKSIARFAFRSLVTIYIQGKIEFVEGSAFDHYGFEIQKFIFAEGAGIENCQACSFGYYSFFFVPQSFDVKSFSEKNEIKKERFLVYKSQEHLDELLKISDEKLKERLTKNGGCYIATAVYGSYDCPEVWVLRRYRDSVLSNSIFGRLFIKLYYRVSPKVVKLFGKSAWFNRFWKNALDKKVERLKSEGFEDKPYSD